MSRGEEPTASPGIADYRREALPDPESVGEDESLAAAIRDEIARTGPMTFARFMERALYEPGHGYYRRPSPGPGRHGDFLTSPEAHPIFGAAVGRLLEQAWDAMGRPAEFVITEPGAGTGTLAAGLLDGLREVGPAFLDAVRYQPLEVEAARLDTLRERLATAGLADRLVLPGTVIGPAAGAVIANEVLDALPVHRVVGRTGGPLELLVTAGDDGGFTWVEGDLSTPALADRLQDEGISLAEGQVTEICVGVDGWLADATRDLGRGIVVLLDYAEEPAVLHGPGHPDGTLRTFARHAVGGDPFRHVGRQDLTATVDLAAVRASAAAVGLRPLGETTQAELLARVGTAELVGSYLRRPGATLQDGLALRSALTRLLDPRGMGGFRVLAFGRGLPEAVRLPALERVARPGGAQDG